MKVLLVQPRRSKQLGFNGVVTLEPLGLETVGAALEGHEVRILDLFDETELVPTLERWRPQAVGLNCSFTMDVRRTLRLAEVVKEVLPKSFVFVGGHHASLSPEDLAAPQIDAVVIGEGEAVAPELLARVVLGLPLAGLAGVAPYRPGDLREAVIHRPLATDLDALPAPDRRLTADYRDLYHLGFRRPIATVETSRGCPFRCNFCSVWRYFQGQVRTKSPERVIQELWSLDPAIREVFFTDDNFLADVNRARRVADLIERSELPRRRYIFQARSDTVVRHPEVVEKWRRIGLSGVFIGFEKADQGALDGVRKSNNVGNNEQALAVLRRRDIAVYASFIVDPGATLLDFRKLGHYVARHRLRQPYFSVLTPLPGTELFDGLKDRLTSRNYDLFDLLHAVLPTELPLPSFYREMARLYRRAYFRPRHVWQGLAWSLRSLRRGEITWEQVLTLGRGIRYAFRTRSYLETSE